MAHLAEASYSMPRPRKNVGDALRGNARHFRSPIIAQNGLVGFRWPRTINAPIEQAARELPGFRVTGMAHIGKATSRNLVFEVKKRAPSIGGSCRDRSRVARCTPLEAVLVFHQSCQSQILQPAEGHPRGHGDYARQPPDLHCPRNGHSVQHLLL